MFFSQKKLFGGVRNLVSGGFIILKWLLMSRLSTAELTILKYYSYYRNIRIKNRIQNLREKY